MYEFEFLWTWEQYYPIRPFLFHINYAKTKYSLLLLFWYKIVKVSPPTISSVIVQRLGYLALTQETRFQFPVPELIFLIISFFFKPKLTCSKHIRLLISRWEYWLWQSLIWTLKSYMFGECTPMVQDPSIPNFCF